MTRWQHFASSLRISRLLLGLFLVACIKVTALTSLVMQSQETVSADPMDRVTEAIRELEAEKAVSGMVAGVAQSLSGGVALAQTGAAGGDPANDAATQAAMDAAAAGQPASREALARKQEELNRREAAIRKLEQEVDAKLARLSELEARIDQMLKEAGEMKDDKLKHLVDVYSNMKAKQAAAVLETLDETIAVKILAGMRGRQAGEILTYVEPTRAAKLSESLTRMQIPFK